MHQLTAAHRDLPLGTWILVTNLENGRSVELRVNDRGPFVGDRILDVSHAAGKLLGMIGPGVVPVRIAVTREAVLEGGVPLGLTARFTVQAGSFSSLENARRLERSLAESFPATEVVRREVAGEIVFRVWVGDFPRRSDAQSVAEQLAARGISSLVIERGR
jgi:rare lipoprotein A